MKGKDALYYNNVGRLCNCGLCLRSFMGDKVINWDLCDLFVLELLQAVESCVEVKSRRLVEVIEIYIDLSIYSNSHEKIHTHDKTCQKKSELLSL